MVIDARHRQVHILAGLAREMGADSAASSRSKVAHVAFDVKGEPVAALPMRLNTDARSDLVIGINGRRFVSVMATAPAAVFTVNSTGDGSDANPSDGVCNDGTGACTLRAAIEQANVNPGADAINFNIPGGGPQNIVSASVVYQLNESVTIDGATQPGFAGQPLIELKGGGATSGSGMIIAAANCVVRGIRINDFGANGIHVLNSSGHFIEGNILGVNAAAAAGNRGHGIEVATSSNVTIGGTVAAARNIISGNARAGIRIQAGASGSRLQGNYIGTNEAGTAAIPNGCGPCLEGGILIDESSNNVIGGATAGAGNVISGNNGDGIGIWEGASTGNQVFGNFIGVAANGATPLGNNANAGPNTGGGIAIRNFASNNQIGGIAAGQGNIIANNIPYGISVYSGQGNAIQGNSIYANSGGSATEGLGIDLGADGVTQNDSGDADAGPNGLQNFATVSSATLIAGGGVFVQGSLNARSGAQYEVEFFSSLACDPSGNGEGQTYIGRVSVTTNSAGLASFSASFNALVSTGSVITSLVVDSAGNTSEFSPCATLGNPQGPNVQAENVLVLPDLITAIGTGFIAGTGTGTASMLVNGVGFDQPTKVEDQGRRVTQAGQLVSPVNGSRTIDGAVQPGMSVTITFINAAGGATAVPFTRSPLPPPPPNPPLVLTNVTRSGGFINITGELTAEPNTLYVIYFRLTQVVEAPVAPGGCPAREEPKSFLGSIEVRTDGNGKAIFGSPAPVTFPEPQNGGTGIVSAYAVPFDVVEGQKKPSQTKKVIDSNCAGLSPSSAPGVHLIQEITVTSNDITAIGFGFVEGVEVFVDDVGFEKKATVTGQLRMTVKQDGRLKNGKTIAEAVPEGVVVRIRFRNPDGGFTEVGFRR
ncbi:MAG: right-handed parallel beta-helix repeat-containing protein [Blastocatellia bacterium]|nr:right-handed parallel beta-helix repeat-containing protein [Blastocatellia bacterium]